MKKTTRQIGHKLEHFVADYLKETDKTAKPTKNSGASTQIADVLNRDFFIECKKVNKENVSLKSKVWNKLLSEMPVGTLKVPLYITQNIKNETWVTLDIKDFIRLLENTK